jgi:hypothetical protein
MPLSLAILPIIIIYLIVAIRIIKRRGKLGNREFASVVFIGAIGAIVVIIPPDIDILYRILAVAVIVAFCIIFYFGFREKRDKPDPAVTLYYPIIVTDDNFYKYIPAYITNNRIWQAYPLSRTVIQLCVREKGVRAFASYPSSEEMQRALKQFYTLKEEPATLDDLWIIKKGDEHSLSFYPNPFSQEVMEKLAK